MASLDKQIFADEAIQLIYQRSKGVPRRVNNICPYDIIAAAIPMWYKEVWTTMR